ncbi:ABC transporter substrate-binding protein [Aquamicrobium sp.]|uniref:ABC transporter substrate-binding protein n=1 Tax=Aquamicrobium sp. TaxID=1872579 RepID=UPI00258B4390|nr:ABC transporter substrate-binding protein [Aquamicrobium sp.]MCK9549688.1 ABC transporter substrate-binding protein [Aquamicrobium sp.]
MRKTLTRLVTAVFLGCASMAGVAMAQDGATSAEITRGGTLNMIVQPEPPMLIVGLNTQGPTLYVAGQIYQSLLTYREDLKPLPQLAKSWTVSEDGLTYTFNLQEGVKWHDGEAFTSKDVVFAAEEFLVDAHPRWRLIREAYVESVTAPDDLTVVFRLKKPFSAFLYGFELSSFPIMPAHLYQGTDYRTNANNTRPIGTGPYKFEDWQRGSYIHLVRNEDYWKEGQPYIDDLYFRVIPDAASRAIAFEQGTVDLLRGGDVEGFTINSLTSLPGVETTTAGWEYFSPQMFLQPNLRLEVFKNKDVRKAVYHALDRDFIVNAIFFGQGKVSTGPFAESMLFHDPNIQQYPYDMELAKKLIADSGVDLSKHPIRLLGLPYGSTWDRMTEYVKQQLEELGFVVSIQAVDAGGWLQAMGNFDFDLAFSFLYQFGHPAQGVSRIYFSDNQVKGTHAGNNGGYENPEVDAMFRKAADAIDEAEAAEAYTKVQQILAEEVPVLWMFDMKNTTIYRDKIRNPVRTAIGLNEPMDEVWIAR